MIISILAIVTVAFMQHFSMKFCAHRFFLFLICLRVIVVVTLLMRVTIARIVSGSNFTFAGNTAGTSTAKPCHLNSSRSRFIAKSLLTMIVVSLLSDC
jgi:hypothetical protein